MPDDVNPEYLAVLAEAVREFRSALRRYLELFDFNEHVARGIAPALYPKVTADPLEIQRLTDDVAEAAGRAAGAVRLTNVYFMVQGVGKVDPIAAWSGMAQPKPVLEPENILSACGQILGRLAGLADQARFNRPADEEIESDGGDVPDHSARPRVFIGSSTERLNIASALQVALDYEFEAEIWHQGLFEPGGSTLATLAREAPAYDFAVLIVTPDDSLTTSRGEALAAARDNVIFELGLFIGALGADRTFMLYDDNHRPDLPSDVAGVTPVTYRLHTSGNLEAAMGAPSTKLRTTMKRAGFRNSPNVVAERPTAPSDVRSTAQPPRMSANGRRMVAVGDYRDGMSVREVAAKNGVSQASVRQWIADADLDPQEPARGRPSGGQVFTRAEMDIFRANYSNEEFRVLRTYNLGDKSIQDVAADLQMTPTHVFDVLRRAGLSQDQILSAGPNQ